MRSARRFLVEKGHIDFGWLVVDNDHVFCMLMADVFERVALLPAF